MRVLICGAGQVGYNIAAYLSQEENDVTVIDSNAQLISEINNELDVNGIVGHASNPDVLQAANAKDADLMIAVTFSDEVNMVACQIGHSLFGIPKKIARIREQAYLQPAWANLFSRSHMPIDVIISPEVVLANEIYKRLSVPGTTYVTSLADGLVHLLGVICGPNCPIVNTPLRQLKNLFPDLSFKVLAIVRDGKPIITSDDEQLKPDDEVFFIVDTQHLKRTMAAFGHEEKEARKLVIAGGGNIGFGLTKLLQARGRGAQLKIIERNENRAKFLSENLDNVIILNGSSLDRDLLEEASIDSAETFIAVTNDDESNILGSLLAKKSGCKRAITLVNNTAYSPLVGSLGIDAIVSPRSTIVATIMQHVRRGRIKGLHNLRDGFAEVIEAEISETSRIANTRIDEIELPENVAIACIVRDGQVMLPAPEMIVHAEDHCIIFTPHEQTQNVEKLFTVHVDLF